MKVTGIIAEYNPFHNGHLHQIEEIRKSQTDYIIVVTSGDFTQRGTPAVIDKYARTQMALSCGADLVLELPALFACSSSWYFARGGVSLLDKLGIVDHLCFGCEAKDPSIIVQSADILLHETEMLKEEIKKYIKNGLPFPKAKELAMAKASDISYPSNFYSPNNILALEYCLALKERNSKIVPMPIRRDGLSYYEEQLISGKSPSATAVRSLLEKDTFPDEIEEFVPASVYSILKEQFHTTFPIRLNDFSSLLNYKLLLEGKNGFARFFDVSSSLSDKIENHRNQFRDFTSFCHLLKSKDITYTRINRALSHIMLHMMEETAAYYKEHDFTPYARILGLKKEASPLLSAIKKNASIPFVSKLADAGSILSDDAMALLNLDILSSHIYQSVVSDRYHAAFQNENTRQIISF